MIIIIILLVYGYKTWFRVNDLSPYSDLSSDLRHVALSNDLRHIALSSDLRHVALITVLGIENWARL